MAVVAVEAEERTTPAADLFKQRFILTVKDRLHEGGRCSSRIGTLDSRSILILRGKSQ
jgi:hypothetical protein